MNATNLAKPGIDASEPMAEPSAVVRVGAVRYLNTVPLIGGLDKATGLEIRLEPPARLVDLLAPPSGRAPEVDLALCSIIDAQAAAAPLEIVPVGAIACDGPTRTVRVFSRVPFDQVRTLHADAESHTSVALARIILARQFEARPTIVPLEANAALDETSLPETSLPETLLLIGDKTITKAPPILTHPHRLDLSAAWRGLTGLPFVYAAWMCRAGAFEARPELRSVAALLDRQRRRNVARVGWSAAQSAATHGWSPATAKDYLANELRFHLDGEARRAITTFFEHAADIGAIDSVKPIRWAG